MNQKHLVMALENIIILIYFGILIFNGFINNFIYLEGLPNTGTISLDMFIIISFYIFLIIFAKRIISNSKVSRKWISANLAYLFFAMLCLIPLIVSNGSFMQRLLGYRNIVVYMGIFFIISLIHINKSTIQFMLDIFLSLAIILALFGIVQSIFTTLLPSSLLLVKNQTNVFAFYQTDIMRSNGLLGTTITFSGFLCFIFSLFVARYLVIGSKFDLIALIIIVISNILTYCRASFGAFFLIFFTNYLIIKGISFKNMVLSGLIIIALGATILGYQSLSGNKFIFERLTNKDAQTQKSTALHILQTINAVKNIIAHPLIGVGIGSQGWSSREDTKIIYDGFWFQLVLELGIPLALLYSFIYFYSTYIAVVIAKRSIDPLKKILGVGFVGGGVAYFFMGFIDSAFFAPVPYALFWTVFGLLLCLDRNNASDEAILCKNPA